VANENGANATQPTELPAPVTTNVTPGVQNTAAMVGGVLVTEDQIRVADDPLYFGSFRRMSIPAPDPRIRTVSRRDRAATVELTRIGYQPGAAPVNGNGPAAPAGGARGRASDVQQYQPGK
jgi:hypothetical protein